MKYIVLEIQTNTDGTVGTLINDYDYKTDAESKYHAILSAAAISNLPRHCAFLLDDSGNTLRSEVYRHDSIPARSE